MPEPQSAERWLSSAWTWVLIIGITLALMLVVRLVADAIEARWPDPREGEDDPWRWTD
jgi:hypothetical protein